MSGGDFSSGGNGGFTDVNACDSLIINTHISSPKEAAVSSLKVDDLLDISLDSSGQYDTVVLLNGGVIAGGIASPQLPMLIQCIRAGTDYVGQVLRVNDGQVKVRISPIRSE
jgi:hypothetical protein